MNNNKYSICFITQTARIDDPILDGSSRYRCFHPAEALEEKGCLCSVYSHVQFFNNPCLDYDIYVFHRPRMSKELTTIISLLNFEGKILVADYDDLIFGNQEDALQSSIFKNRVSKKDEAIKIFEKNLKALLLFKHVTVSTSYLLEKVKSYNSEAKVHIEPNFIPSSLISLHETLKTYLYKRSLFQIGYFCGTKSHDLDFAVIEEVLHRVLCENSKLKLLVVGPLALPKSIAMLQNVQHVDAVNYLQLFELMKLCSCTIAPLESSEFNFCKSRVKFLEAALAGCKLIATPIPDMKAVGPKHIHFANTKDEWYKMLSLVGSQNIKAEVQANFIFLKENNVFEVIKSIVED